MTKVHPDDVLASPAGSEDGLLEMGIRQWLQLGEINDVDSTFGGQMLVALHYKDEAIEAAPTMTQWVPASQHGNFVAKVPLLAFSSCPSAVEYERNIFVRPATKEVFIWLGYHMTIKSNMPLQEYPFDRQLFRVGITCREARLVRWHLCDGPQLGVQQIDGDFRADCDVQCWQLEGVETVEVFNQRHTCYVRTKLRLQRDASYAVWNFMVRWEDALRRWQPGSVRLTKALKCAWGCTAGAHVRHRTSQHWCLWHPAVRAGGPAVCGDNAAVDNCGIKAVHSICGSPNRVRHSARQVYAAGPGFPGDSSSGDGGSR